MSLADIADDFATALGVKDDASAETTYHVAVEPVAMTPDTYLVAVSADTDPTAGVVRTEKEFELLQSALQQVNQQHVFRFPLPKLPARPRSLFKSGAASADERAVALQEHLAELVSHPEVVRITAFQVFIRAPA